MYPLYDGIMSNSCGPLGEDPVYCQTVSNFFNLFFPPPTPEDSDGPGASTDTFSGGRLSKFVKICLPSPIVFD